jgi:hypothetical protein
MLFEHHDNGQRGWAAGRWRCMAANGCTGGWLQVPRAAQERSWRSHGEGRRLEPQFMQRRFWPRRAMARPLRHTPPLAGGRHAAVAQGPAHHCW